MPLNFCVVIDNVMFGASRFVTELSEVTMYSKDF